MSAIEAFLAEMRHELRTPVNAILGYSELLLEEHGASLTTDARHDLERLIEAGQQLLRIVSESLDVERPRVIESVAVVTSPVRSCPPTYSGSSDFRL